MRLAIRIAAVIGRALTQRGCPSRSGSTQLLGALDAYSAEMLTAPASGKGAEQLGNNAWPLVPASVSTVGLSSRAWTRRRRLARPPAMLVTEAPGSGEDLPLPDPTDPDLNLSVHPAGRVEG